MKQKTAESRSRRGRHVPESCLFRSRWSVYRPAPAEDVASGRSGLAGRSAWPRQSGPGAAHSSANARHRAKQSTRSSPPTGRARGPCRNLTESPAKDLDLHLAGPAGYTPARPARAAHFSRMLAPSPFLLRHLLPLAGQEESYRGNETRNTRPPKRALLTSSSPTR